LSLGGSVEIIGGHGIVLGSTVRAHFSRPINPRQRCGHEYQRPHEVRTTDGQLQRDTTTKRPADHTGTGHADFVEGISHISCMRDWDIRNRRAPKAR